MPKFNDFELDLTTQRISNDIDSNEVNSISMNLSCSNRCISSKSVGVYACTIESYSNCP